jgi:hypothetical protein
VEVAVDDGGELVEVETFTYADAAKVAEGLLRSEEIPCYVRNENGFPTGPFWAEYSGLLRLMVPGSYAEQARELLRSRVTDEALSGEAERPK